uniref:Uncharacterized protein n=1 Tax=Myoviridae sp. ctxi06 TaxID=2826713 RepID=A0A8S5R3I5_9CAUD|nr:MAG TPA: hypothetical protein [Myoviridae sp. ctxi06]DAH71944.1 MAG TPA: hypothetical protein [Caudoviricetes sp.]DAY80169.1 MAG TPA: hypothetical protein [Caudoviricetes sp.]
MRSTATPQNSARRCARPTHSLLLCRRTCGMWSGF